jgi:hypothetical protein
MTATISMNDLAKVTRIHERTGTAMYIKGAPGIGKTSFFKDFAYAKGPDYFYGTLNASTAILPDVVGFLLPHEETFGDRTVDLGRFTYPHFMRDERTLRPAFTYERGMIVVDEVDKGAQEVKKALAILQEEKRLGEHALPPAFQIVLLGNRAADRSGSSKDFDFVINRRGEYELKPDMMAWIDWAQNNGVSTVAMAFASRNPEIVFNGKIPDEQGPWCTPRSLVKADMWSAAAEQEGIVVDPTKGLDDAVDNMLWVQGVAAHIGTGPAAQLLAFKRLHHTLPRMSVIMSDPKGAPVPDTPDAMMLLSYELAHRTTRENLPTVASYMQRLPKPFAVSYVRVLMNKEPSYISTRTMGDWCMQNSALLQAVAPRS